MHGMIFVALEQHLSDLRAEAVRGEVFRSGAYLAIGDYPDEDVLRIAERYAKRPGAIVPESVVETLRSFGEAVPPLIAKFAPNLMPRTPSFDALLALVEKSTASDARTLLPKFSVEPRDDGLVELHHRGHTELCRFSEGLLVGFAALTGESVAFRHPNCVRRGDARCVFVARMLRSETTSQLRIPKK